MNRSKAREYMMQLIFQMGVQDQYDNKLKEDFISEYISNNQQNDYIDAVIKAYVSNREEVDSKIEGASKNWKLSRISKVDLSILRLAVTEICYLDEIPVSVSADEAVELAKKFGGQSSGKFINGILGKIIRDEK